MNCIAYSLFGLNQHHDNCFEFRAYLRGFHLNMRMAELLYPGWKVVLMVDEASYNGKYRSYFDSITGHVNLYVLPTAELCRMMLYRLYPIYQMKGSDLKYDRVLCRDTDSLLSYRERQAVAYWEQGSKMAHAITDSISHTITLMGGMIGFRAGPFQNRTGTVNWEDLMKLAEGQNLSGKGSDQEFLNRVILPKIADSITEHFVLGHPQTFRGDCHNFIHDIDLNPIGVLDDLKATNGYAFHIGASGFQTDAVVKMLQEYGSDQWNELEKLFPEVFYWTL